jgi:DNA-directed RNA polymerase specialized sigma subunit
VVSDQKKNEMDLYHEWKQTGSKEAFHGLYNSMKPLLINAARKASYNSTIPQSAHQIWAAQNMLDALRTYKPDAGASLQTHVYTAVNQKGKRLNYLYANVGKMPEPRAARIGLYQNEMENLRSELDRTPSAAELSDRLGWSLKTVELTQKEVHKNLSISDGVDAEPFYESSLDRAILDDIYFDLSGAQQNVYDHIFGLHGKQKLTKANGRIDFDEIGRRSGYSSSKARALYTQIRSKAEKAFRR